MWCQVFPPDIHLTLKFRYKKITAYLTVVLLFTTLTGSWLPSDDSLGDGMASSDGFAGNKIDSLKTVIQTTDHDTTKIKALNKLGWSLMYSNPDTAIILGNQALELTEKTKDEKSKANTLHNLGAYHYIKSDYPTALDHYHKSLEIRKSLNDKKGIAVSYNNIGMIYHEQSSYPQALEYYFKSLKIEVQLGNKKGMAASYNNVGIIYMDQSSYPQALGYYFKSLKIKKQLGNKKGMANSYNNIGLIYYEQSSYPQALEYYFKSLKIKKQLGDKQGMAGSYGNIGNLYTSLFKQGDSLERAGRWALENPALLLDTALYYQQQALLINQELSSEYGMTYSLSGIGSIYAQKQQYTKAIQYYQQAALLADSIGALHEGFEAHSELSECYEQLGSYKLSLEHYKQYTTLKDTVFNQEKSKDIGKLEARHEMEMAEIKRKQEEKEQARILEQQTQRRHLLQYSGIFIFIIGIFAILLFSGRLNIPVRVAKSGVFFTFLLVFEFVLVLIDPYIEQWTGGEPAYNLMVNVGLAGLFLPLHNIAVRKLEQRLFKTRKKIATKAQRHEIPLKQ